MQPASEQPSPPDEKPAQGTPPLAPPGLLQELMGLGQALKQLFGAQLRLLGAELGLARGALSLLLLMGLIATVAGVGLMLSLLGLIGVLLAQWLGSWIWALLVLSALQGVLLVLALWLFRRCMHWMSFPASRGQWHAMMGDTVRQARRQVDAEAGEHV
ncbi:MAG: ABC transporter ATP-binding protein [Dyella sp.]